MSTIFAAAPGKHHPEKRLKNFGKPLQELNKCFYICSRFLSEVLYGRGENLHGIDLILIFAFPDIQRVL
jgi:hypothetical protein